MGFRNRVWLVGAAVAIAVLVVMGLQITRAGSDTSTTADSRVPTVDTSVEKSAPGVKDRGGRDLKVTGLPDDPEAATELIVNRTDEMLRNAYAHSPEETAATLSAVADEGYVGEVVATAARLKASGYGVSGKTKVYWTTANDGENGQRTVAMCVDQSGLRFVTKSGKDRGPASSAKGPVLNLYSLSPNETGGWRIASHSFPDDPTCDPSGPS